MLLSDVEIRQMRDLIHPFDDSMVQPASIDVRLAKELIDPQTEFRRDCTRGYTLLPGEFLLGCTIETIALPVQLAARFEGKSSLARRGLASHITAGFIDPGFTGQITVELSNVSQQKIILTAGMRIGQVCFMRMSTTPSGAYGDPRFGSHYQGQQGPTLSRS